MSQVITFISNTGAGGFIQTLTADNAVAVVPTAGNINVIGGSNLTTVGAGSNLTIDLDNTVSISGSMTAGTGFSATTGDVAIVAGNLTLPNTNVTGTQGEIVVGGTRYYNNFGTGGNNLFWGANAGRLNAGNTGSANVGYGGGVFAAVTGATSSSAFGYLALAALTSGSNVTALGSAAAQNLTTGGNSTFVGYQSGGAVSTGSGNTALGYQAGNSWAAASANNINIGNVGAAESGTIRIGTNAVQTAAYLAGVDGVNVGSVAKVVTLASDQLGTATIIPGAGIVVTPGANTITISSIGAGLTWSVITANQTAVVENGYFCNKASTLALALPAASAVGDVIEITNENVATGAQFTQAASQQILIGNTNTTAGVGGTLTSTAVGDTLKIVCKTANLVWRVTSMVGNWTVV